MGVALSGHQLVALNKILWEAIQAVWANCDDEDKDVDITIVLPSKLNRFMKIEGFPVENDLKLKDDKAYLRLKPGSKRHKFSIAGIWEC